MAKPWRAEDLQQVVREQLTDFVLGEGLDPLPHLPALDAARAMGSLRWEGGSAV